MSKVYISQVVVWDFWTINSSKSQSIVISNYSGKYHPKWWMFQPAMLVYWRVNSWKHLEKKIQPLPFSAQQVLYIVWQHFKTSSTFWSVVIFQGSIIVITPPKKKNMSFWRRQQIVYIYQGNVHDLFSAVSACVPASSKWPFDSPIGGHQQALKRSLKTAPKGHTEEPCVYHRYIDDQQLPRMDAKQNMTMEEKKRNHLSRCISSYKKSAFQASHDPVMLVFFWGGVK